jgi:hypothetical protein
MKPMFTQSAETNSIVGFFRELSIGSETSFSAVSKALGFPVASDLPSYQSAKRIALRDHGVVIEGVRGFGFVRLNGSEMVKKGFRTMTGIRRAARRGSAVTEIAVRQNLNRNEMLDATEQLSRFRIIETTSRQFPAKSNRKVAPETLPADQFDTRAALRKVGS